MQISRHHVGPRMNTDGHPRRHHLSVRADRGRNGGRRGPDPGDPRQARRTAGRAGSSKSKLLQVQIWLADIRSYDEMNAVWDAWVDPVNTPGRATCEARMATARVLVEIISCALRFG
jgi:hypothetical protein